MMIQSDIYGLPGIKARYAQKTGFMPDQIQPGFNKVYTAGSEGPVFSKREPKKTVSAPIIHSGMGLPEYALGDYQPYQPATGDTVPHPRKVLFRSMIIPGWGQVTNRQYWKVPIVYGLLGGLVVYSIWTHNQYTDYRAAFYNAASGNDDQRFGPTPPNLMGVPQESLRFSRNSFRNQRDFSFILIALAYGLNILDAYIFAHFRDFDVSDDLAYAFTAQHEPFGQPVVNLRYRIRF
ncbi:MAG: DUF5683 domain-containing protein [Cyclonatronaceae bacterium]